MIDRAHGGNIRQYFKDNPERQARLIDFSANINPLGISPEAKKAIIKNISRLTSYPEPYSGSLKLALADFHRIKANNLAVGSGSIELIYLIPKAFKARRVLIITPTFSEYEFAARAYGLKPVFFKTQEKDNFRINLDKLKGYLPSVELVFLCNPNNPTGVCLTGKDLAMLVKLCLKRKAILAVDEAFMDFVDAGQENGFVSLAAQKKGLLIIRSLTKFFALPGLRLGYAIGQADFIRKISELQYPWNVNSLAQAAGETVLREGDYIGKSRSYVSKERKRLFCGLREIKGLKVFAPSSNFILCKLEASSLKSAKVLNERLLVRHLVVRDCTNFRGLNEKFFRVAVRKTAQNFRLIQGLKQVLSR